MQQAHGVPEDVPVLSNRVLCEVPERIGPFQFLTTHAGPAQLRKLAPSPVVVVDPDASEEHVTGFTHAEAAHRVSQVQPDPSHVVTFQRDEYSIARTHEDSSPPRVLRLIWVCKLPRLNPDEQFNTLKPVAMLTAPVVENLPSPSLDKARKVTAHRERASRFEPGELLWRIRHLDGLEAVLFRLVCVDSFPSSADRLLPWLAPAPTAPRRPLRLIA